MPPGAFAQSLAGALDLVAAILAGVVGTVPTTPSPAAQGAAVSGGPSLSLCHLLTLVNKLAIAKWFSPVSICFEDSGIKSRETRFYFS